MIFGRHKSTDNFSHKVLAKGLKVISHLCRKHFFHLNTKKHILRSPIKRLQSLKDRGKKTLVQSIIY
jgi:hypothetical protein